MFIIMILCKELLCALMFFNAINCVKNKIIIDNDAGVDDALAIFLALLAEKHYNGPELVGLTTGNGNTDETNVCINNQRILKVAQRQDVPIYKGSKASILTTPASNYWYGLDGLGDNDDEEELKDLFPAHNKKAVEALIEQSEQHKGNLTIIAIGSLTNLALTILIDPGFLERLNHLYIGAGHIHDDIYTKAQFNAFVDVEAYHIVTKHATPDKVTILPYSVARKVLSFSKEWRQNVFGAIETAEVKALNRYERLTLNKTRRWEAIDPLVVAVFLRPSIVTEYKYSNNSIILSGAKRGFTTNRFSEHKENTNVRIIFKVNADEYKEFLLNLFKIDDARNHLLQK